MKHSLVTFLSAVLALALTGCSDDSPSQPANTGDGGAAQPNGFVRGTITYAGAKTGVMKLALYKSLPPAGPPPASFKQENAKFPLTYQIEAPPGDYKFIGFLDVNNDGNQATPGVDPVVPTNDAVVPSGGSVTIDVTITDP
jgi:hypothetical protein